MAGSAPQSSFKPLLAIGLVVVLGVVALAALRPRHAPPPPAVAPAAVADAGPDAVTALDAAVLAPAPDLALDAGLAESADAAGPRTAVAEEPAAPDASVAPLLARYHVDSSPSGAWISVDGRVLGSAPLVVQLTPGAHLLHAELLGRSPSDLAVSAAPGGREDVVLALVTPHVERPPATVTVTVSPPGAMVSLDGREVGPAPITFTVEPDTSHQITARRVGYLQRGAAVSVGAGELRQVEIVLVPLR